MNPKLIAKELDEIDSRLKAIRQERASLIAKTVAGCSHPVEDVRELDYTETGAKPWLICTHVLIERTYQKQLGSGWSTENATENKLQ